MATSIMDTIQENVNPVSVSNALYELMLDWRSTVMMSQMAPNRSTRKKYNKKRSWIEGALSRFLGQNVLETRRLLEQHFGLKVGGPS